MEYKLEEIKEAEIVKELKEKKVLLSKQAERILNGIQSLGEIGRMIFLDRYSIKSKKEDINVGDLVIVVTKKDPKYPKKDLAIVLEEVDEFNFKVLVITGDKKDEVIVQEKALMDKPTESLRDAYNRIALAAASIEKKDREKAYKQFLYHLDKHHIQPAGRIMAGATVDKEGNYTGNLTLYNCYVIPSPKDSRKGIIHNLEIMTEIMSRGGGVGMNLSTLRPRYSYVRGVHGKSSGSVSWGALYSYATGLIEQGGSRRGALMLMLADWHPDVEEFIESKKQKGYIENANISVLISDEFMDAVKNDEEWPLKFPDYESVSKEVYENEWNGDVRDWEKKGLPVKIYKKIRARDLWHKLMESAWASAEPGIVFIDRYNKESNSWYFNKLIATNPCGEQGLPAWGVCNLGHLNLPSFLKKVGEDDIGPLYEVDWEELKSAARTLTRFLDNMIDLTPYHFKENEENQKSERRIGGGTLGLGEMLIRLRLKYGSDEATEFIDKLYETITTEMYKESTNLAGEKGAFPKFDKEKFLQSGFVKRLPEEIKELIKKKGIRNVTLTTQAPTGTVGTMLGTSTGIEPFYSFKFYRQSRLGTFEVEIPLAQEYKKVDGKLPDFFVSSMDLTPEEHVKVQAVIQKWTDSSISKTANVPSDYTVEETKRLYEKAFEWGCKGVTIYRDGSRHEQVLTTKKTEENKTKTEKEATEAKSTDKVEFKNSLSKEDEELLRKAKELLSLRRDVSGSGVNSMYYEVETGYGTLHVNIVYDNLGPVKIFANISPLGTEISGLTSALSILISKYLQLGGDPSKLLKHLNSIKGDKPFGFGPNRVDSIPHALGKVLRDHLMKTGKLNDSKQKTLLNLKTFNNNIQDDTDNNIDNNMNNDALEALEEIDKIVNGNNNSIDNNSGVDVSDVSNSSNDELFCPKCFSRNVVMQSGCSEPICLDCGYSKCG